MHTVRKPGLVALAVLAAVHLGLVPRAAAQQEAPEPVDTAGQASDAALAARSDAELAAEMQTFKLERGFGIASLAVGGAGVLFGVLAAVWAADQPCLWGSCAPSEPDQHWMAGGALIASAGVALVITGAILVVSGLLRRGRVDDERRRRTPPGLYVAEGNALFTF